MDIPAEIEAAIVADPDDAAAYGVLADYLQERGDPRGELIALQLAGKLLDADLHLARHSDYLLGPLAAHVHTHDGNMRNNGRINSAEWLAENHQAFLWKAGFIHRARLTYNIYQDRDFEGRVVDLLRMLFDHDSGRFVAQLAFNENGDPTDGNLQDLIDLVGERAPPTLRKIVLGDNVDQISWHHTGDLSRMWRGVPNLRVLEIETGDVTFGEIHAPSLQQLVVKTGGLSAAAFRSLAALDAPKLEHLEIYLGEPEWGCDCTIDDVLQLLAREDLPALTYLGVKNSMFQNDIARAVVDSKLLPQLKVLDLSLGAMTDDGAQILIDARDALRHLATIDLSHNFLGDAAVRAVSDLAAHVITADRQPVDEEFYYVAVSE